VAIGREAGNTDQGSNSVALGRSAGVTDQGNNGIIINSTGAVLDDTTAGHIHIASNKASFDFEYGDGTNNGQWSFSTGDVSMPANLAVNGIITGTNIVTMEATLNRQNNLIALLEERLKTLESKA
tara:strand:- start:1318 stop:1692 length:375 start_codon:yes stop_codon:yes gene_type:complete